MRIFYSFLLLLFPLLAFAQAPTTAPPTPDEAAENVISVFSDAYTNTPVTNYLAPWSQATLTDVVIADNAILLYDPLGFAGIEVLDDNALDLTAAGITHVHFDVWTPNATAFRLKLVDFGEDGFGDDDSPERANNTEREIQVTPEMGSWVSYDIPLTQFAGMNFTDINQLVISGDPFPMATIYLDNLYFYAGDGGGEPDMAPTTAAPVPQAEAEDVISIYSDAFDNVPVTNYIAPWSQATLSDTVIDGSNMLRYDNLSFAGIEMLDDLSIDAESAGMNAIHFSYWSPNATAFRFKLVDFGGDGFGEDDSPERANNTEAEVTLAPLNGVWNEVTLPLTEFAGMNFTDVVQIVISADPFGSTTVFLDDIYFVSADATGAALNLPVTFEDEDVNYQLFDFEGTASTLIDDATDAGNTVAQTVKTAGAQTFAGTSVLNGSTGGGFEMSIPFSSTATVISVRVWSALANIPVRLKVEDASNPQVSVETEATVTQADGWQTLDFDFANEAPGTAAINLDAIYDKLTIFFNFGNTPAADQTYFWDDIQFTGTGGTGGGMDEPMVAAPTPTRQASDVISMFSDAYDNVPVDTWLTSWSSAQLEDITIEGNATKKYTNLDFAGIETQGTPIDLTGMTHLHVDYWTPNMDTFRIKLVDFGGDGFGDDGTPERANNTEDEEVFMTQQGQWVGLDIPLADFEMDQMDINQFIISGLPAGSGTVYLDNVYFYDDQVSTNSPELGLLEVFPNPVGSRVQINAPVVIEELTIFAASGRRVAYFQPEAETFAFDTEELSPGIYVALVRSGDRLLTVRLVK